MRVFSRRGQDAGAGVVVAVLVAASLVAGTGPASSAASVTSAGRTGAAPEVGGYWATSYEPGTPRPAGFPARGQARNLRGETTEVTTTVRDVRSGHPNDTSAQEGVTGLADQDSATKWYARDSGRPTDEEPVYAIYTLRTPAAVTGYSLTSANDAPPRDPAAWTVLGSDSAAPDADDSSWHVLDQRKEQRFGARGQTDFYPVTATHAYRHYQLRITDNCADRCQGSTADHSKLQLADWTLRSSAGSTASGLGVRVENADSVGAADGSAALRYAGRVLATGPASSTVVLRSGLDVPLVRGSKLSYAIRPDDAASAHVALDVLYTDPDGRHPRTREVRAVNRKPTPGSGTPSRSTSARSPGSTSARSCCATTTRMPSPAQGPAAGSTTSASAGPSSTPRPAGATSTPPASTRRAATRTARRGPGPASTRGTFPGRRPPVPSARRTTAPTSGTASPSARS